MTTATQTCRLHKPKPPRSAGFASLIGIVAANQSIRFLLQALISDRVELTVSPLTRPDGLTVFDRGNLHVGDAVDLTVSAGELPPGSLVTLIVAHLFFVAGIIATMQLSLRGVATALDSRSSTPHGLRRLTQAAWILAMTFILHAILLWTGASLAIQSLGAQGELSYLTDSQIATTIWGLIASVGLVITIRTLIAWGYRAQRETEGLV